MEIAQRAPAAIWREGPVGWIVLGAVAGLLGFVFYDGIAELVTIWNKREEYSHSYLIPLISLFLVWQKRDAIERLSFRGAWVGWLVVVAGLILLMLGELSTLYILVQYALVFVIAGLVLALTGWRGVKLLWAPLFFLIFMIPLPPFLYNKLSGILQLLSSEFGVQVIRAFGISVFLEGNVIDLGTYRLQVVEACNGLRYLFPLMSFGFLCAYLFQAPLWQRLAVLASTVPVTVLMNSFRIGVIGVLVEHRGASMAEGFLHDFEGWVVFMVCVLILMVEMWLLNRFFGAGRSFREVFGLELPPPSPKDAEVYTRKPQASFIASALLLLPAAALVTSIGERTEAIPEREQFASFPQQLDGWRGRHEQLEDRYLRALKLTDYVLADYQDSDGEWINLYAAYYDSQRKGQSAHSPASCIPGGGWKIVSLTRREVPGVDTSHGTLEVNRVQIEKGEHRQLVYYWFQQRGRLITSEYLVKAYLLVDAVQLNRTDGALVRLTTPLQPGEDWSTGDRRLARFAESLEGRLDAYIPGRSTELASAG
ncbi:MAG: VPLPA-CTERM-specific exosortase XrtD [Gammaproteobacteria bacterium]